MTGLLGVFLLLAGLAATCAIGGLFACTLRLRSPVEFLLATYVLAWTSLVSVVLVLSLGKAVTRAWLLAAVGVLLLAAVSVWFNRGRPSPPRFRPTLDTTRAALRIPVLCLLAIAVLVGAAYSVALAFGTAANEGDALAYHLARVAFWKQAHAVGYVNDAIDVRLNVNPPDAEIGQLTTIELSGTDRYVAVPQLLAFWFLLVSVAQLGRDLRFEVPEALFGALVFATLPVVALQSLGALNDLVVASFLAIAAHFMRHHTIRYLLIGSLALALAVGTKFTALLAFPALAVFVVVDRPRRTLPRVAVAGLCGLIVGSVWLVVNLVETGHLEGGLASGAQQRVDLSASVLATNAMRYVLDIFDMSGGANGGFGLLILSSLVLLVWDLCASETTGLKAAP